MEGNTSAGNRDARARRSRPRRNHDRAGAARARLARRPRSPAARPTRRLPPRPPPASAPTHRSSPMRAAARALVIVATPDRAIEARGARRSRLRSSPMRSCCTSPARRASTRSRRCSKCVPTCESARCIRLQSFPSATMGIERLRGAWAAVAGDPQSDRARARARLAPVRPPRRGAPARITRPRSWPRTISSRCSARSSGSRRRCGVPFEAFAPLVRSSVADAFGVGPARALTGPVARGRSRDRRATPRDARPR